MAIVANENQHYRWGPSSCSRWIVCPGSTSVPAPDVQTVHTIRGTHLHQVVELGLKYGIPHFETGRDADAVEFCLEHAGAIEGEKDLEVTFLSDHIKDFGGTIDVVSVQEPERRIVLADHKFGRTKVEAEGNKQLLSYASLAREVYGPQDEYVAMILQPACYSTPQVVKFTDEEVVAHYNRVHTVTTEDYRVAGDHCKYCHLKKTCREYQAHNKGRR